VKAPSKDLVGLLVGVIAAAIAVFALTPSQWRENVAKWAALISMPHGFGAYAFTFSVALVVSTAVLYRTGSIRVVATRKEWWDKNIASVINNCDEIIVLDTYQGHKHEFWAALENRLLEPRPFHLVYLMKNDHDWFLNRCLEILEVSGQVTEIDRVLVSNLQAKKLHSPYHADKKLEFYYWAGIGPGPLLAWTRKGKETIALGLWVQLKEATDLTPFLIVKRGPLFRALKRHYENVIASAERLEFAKSIPR